jgi:hypothetical protein
MVGFSQPRTELFEWDLAFARDAAGPGPPPRSGSAGHFRSCSANPSRSTTCQWPRILPSFTS